MDSFDWSKAGDCRIGINESVFQIPNCFGAIACDYIVLKKYSERLSPNVVVFRKQTHIAYQYPKMYEWEYNRDGLLIRGSTALVAVQLFHGLGARKVHFVGFDSLFGETRYADSILASDDQGVNMDGFAMINTHLKERIRALRIEAVWEDNHAKIVS